MTARTRRRSIAALSLALVVAFSARARAQDPTSEPAPPSTARVLANEAVERFRRGEWDAALELATRSLAAEADPAVGVLRGRCLEKLGRLVEAADVYDAVRRTRIAPDGPPARAAAAHDAEAALSRLRPRIPRLKLVVAGSGATSQDLEIKLDGRPVPPALLDVAVPIDPGTHRVEASSGGETARAEVRLAEGASERVELRLGAAVASPPRPGTDTTGSQRRWGWVALGGGAAFAAIGVGAGLVALDRKDGLDGACDPLCPAASESDLDTFRATRAISYVGFALATVAVGAGVYLLLTSPSARPTHATVWLGPGRAAVVGRF